MEEKNTVGNLTESVLDDAVLAPEDTSEPISEALNETGEQPRQEETHEQKAKEPGWLKGRLDAAVSKAVRESENRIRGEYEARISRMQEAIWDRDAQDLVDSGEFKTLERAKEEILIQQLHAADDDEFDADRRESYHIPVHYMAYTSGDAEEAEDRNSYLADEAADPSIILEKAISRAEFKRAFHERWSRLTKEQQRLVVRKASGETNVAIAAEQGVSEAAIRKQLKRIQKHFIDIH